LGQKDTVSFAKTLTQSEANNGGGLFMLWMIIFYFHVKFGVNFFLFVLF